VAVAAQIEALPERVSAALAADVEASDRLRLLVAHRVRLDGLLDRAGDQPVSVGLSREYRETLREIDQIIGGVAEDGGVDGGEVEAIGSVSFISR